MVSSGVCVVNTDQGETMHLANGILFSVTFPYRFFRIVFFAIQLDRQDRKLLSPAKVLIYDKIKTSRIEQSCI